MSSKVCVGCDTDKSSDKSKNGRYYDHWYYDSEHNIYCKQCYKRYLIDRKECTDYIMIPCACGCKEMMRNKDRYGIERRYINGHYRKAYPMDMRGSNNPNWTGGIVLEDGYTCVYKPEHPYADNHGKVRKHRLMVEEYLSNLLGLKTYISPSLRVHHINRQKRDNRIENLELMTQSNHMKRHWAGM